MYILSNQFSAFNFKKMGIKKKKLIYLIILVIFVLKIRFFGFIEFIKSENERIFFLCYFLKKMRIIVGHLSIYFYDLVDDTIKKNLYSEYPNKEWASLLADIMTPNAFATTIAF
jgi:hypothetical protein